MRARAPALTCTNGVQLITRRRPSPRAPQIWQVEALRAELSKFKRQAAQDRELAAGSLQAEVDELKRTVRTLEFKLRATEGGF